MDVARTRTHARTHARTHTHTRDDIGIIEKSYYYYTIKPFSFTF